MKDYCLELAAAVKSSAGKYNIIREYLQAYILRIFHDRKAFQSTAFVGGTALRFLYGLPRFSEDLDFSLHKKANYKFTGLLAGIKHELILAGYDADVDYNETKTVKSAFVKFEGLLYEAKLSPLKKKKFSVKIEIDANPPKGAVSTIQIVNKYFPVAFLSYDLPSLFSGKIHAFLTRKYTKGRDYFDIAWYLSRFKTLVPNFTLLHHALEQTGYRAKFPSENDWRGHLSGKVQESDWKKVYRDVVNFLENPKDADIFTKKNVLKLLEG